jgi:hypothetical protein
MDKSSMHENHIRELSLEIIEHAQSQGYSNYEMCMACMVVAAGLSPLDGKRAMLAFFAEALDSNEKVARDNLK